MTTSLPMQMAGYDREYRPPRALRTRAAAIEDADALCSRVAGGAVQGWDLFDLEHRDEFADWARSTLAGLVAAADADAAAALGCIECEDTGFYGLTAADNPDLLTGLVRRVGDDAHERLCADGTWQSYESDGGFLEVLDLDLAGDLASALTAGACGLLQRFCIPQYFLPPSAVVSAAPLGELISAEGTDNPHSEWVNYAVVDEMDPGAVLDLVRTRGDQAQRMVDGEWTDDDDVLLDDAIPVVHLGDELLAALVADAPLTVSPDPRAEKLRRYWSTGKGAAKIRWGTPGDAKRCHRHLEKYMPGRAWAYCNNLHKRNTGVWTGSRFNVGGNGRRGSGIVRGSASDVGSGVLLADTGHADTAALSVVPHIFRVGEVVSFAPAQAGTSPVAALILAAGCDFKVVGVDVGSVVADVSAGTRRVQIVQDVIELQPLGNRSTVQEPSGLVRESRPETAGGNSVSVSEETSLPLPATIFGHDVVRIEVPKRQRVVRSSGSTVAPVMEFTHPALEAARSARVIADRATHDVYCTHPKCGWLADTTYISNEIALMSSLRSGQWTGNQEGTTEMADAAVLDGIYSEVIDGEDGLLRTLTAGGFPLNPPDEWFQNPALTAATPLTITDEGQVYGHIATWKTAHIGYQGQKVYAPRSASGYAFYCTGEAVSASGKKYNVGQLTLAGGHADIRASAAEAVKHYDDTKSGVAEVTAGEDDHGIWVAGSLRSDVTPDQLRVLRASAPSGDWRPINGHLELVAVCQVNVPGFPVARARVASGAITALVAAGARELAVIKASMTADAAVLERLAAVESQVAALGQPGEVELAVIEDSAPTAAPVVGEVPVETPAEAVPVPAEVQTPAEVVVEAPATTEEAPVAAEEVVVAPDTAETVTEAAQTVDAERASALDAARASVQAVRRDMLRAEVHGVTAALPPEFIKNKKSAADKMERKGGGYPIGNEADLKKAIQAFGRSKPEDREATKAHIISAAKKLKLTNLIPENWK